MMKKISNVVGVVFCILTIVFWDELIDNCKQQIAWTNQHQARKDGDKSGIDFIDRIGMESETPEATKTPVTTKTPEVTEAPEYEEKNTDNGTLLDIHPNDQYSEGYDDQDTEKLESYEYVKDAIKAVPKDIKELTTNTEIFDKLTGDSRCITKSCTDLFKESPFTNVCIEDAYFRNMRVNDDGSIIITAGFDSEDNLGVYCTTYIYFYINKDIVDSLDFSNLNTATCSNQRLDLYGFKCSNVKNHESPMKGYTFIQGYNFVAK